MGARRYSLSEIFKNSLIWSCGDARLNLLGSSLVAAGLGWPWLILKLNKVRHAWVLEELMARQRSWGGGRKPPRKSQENCLNSSLSPKGGAELEGDVTWDNQLVVLPPGWPTISLECADLAGNIFALTQSNTVSASYLGPTGRQEKLFWNNALWERGAAEGLPSCCCCCC